LICSFTPTGRPVGFLNTLVAAPRAFFLITKRPAAAGVQHILRPPLGVPPTPPAA